MNLENALDTMPPGLVNSATLDAMIREETRIRVALPPLVESPTEAARHLLREAAALCELLHVVAVVVEQRERNGHPVQGLAQTVRQLTRLDVGKVLRENQATLASSNIGTKTNEPALQRTLSAVESILRDCDVKTFAKVGIEIDAPEEVARITIAIDALKAFVRRNDAWFDQRIQFLGEEYCGGRISVPEIARALEIDVPDAVDLLEKHGYARPVAKLGLSDAARQGIYDELDGYRRSRDSKPTPASAVVRDVIATQRIEGIDARRWFESKLK
jgi:hypothetical protein